VAAYYVVWECVVEQWLGVRRMLSNKRHIQEYTDEQINRLMDNIYHKLNKKLDALINQPNTRHNNGNAPKFQPRLINLTNIKFTKEQVLTLSLGPNYAIEHNTSTN